MTIAERHALTTWEGSLARGAGQVTGGTGALGDLDLTWAARTEKPGGHTSPEELAAAAHSSCFAMALALRLTEEKITTGPLQVKATVTLGEVDGLPTIVSSHLVVSTQATGLDQDEFQKVVDAAAALCPISRLFAGAKVTVDAVLESP